MKRFAAISLSLMMMITNVFADAQVSVKLNDEDVVFSAQQPVIVEGRTLIPLRSIFENIGYEIQWQADTKTAVLTSDNATVTVTANAESFNVNGTDIALDTPAQILNGSMMLPLRAIGEASGLTVGWDNETKVVTLTSADTGNETVAEGSEAKAEMDVFYEDLKALTYLSSTYSISDYEMSKDFSDIISLREEGMLANSRGAERTKANMDYIDSISAKVESMKVPEAYKTAKSSLADMLASDKSVMQIFNNEFNNVYPDEESANADFEAVMKTSEGKSALFSSELGKLNNQYERTMYKYFDTDKDTEENKAVIATFVAELGDIAEKYPIPKEIFDEDDNIITDNIEDNVAKINDIITGRKEAFDKMTAADRCKERLELVKHSNKELSILAESLANYKKYGSDTLNPYYIDVLNAVTTYDAICGLAADHKLGTILSEETEEVDFEKHTDESYSNISFTDISAETSEFVNDYYNMTAVDNYMNQNYSLNSLYGYFLNSDETTTETGKNAISFFTGWRTAQDKLLGYLKNAVVSESVKDLKSAAINYIMLDIDYTKLLQSYYSKQIAEGRYDQQEEALNSKMDSAYNTYESEYSRLDSKLDNYLYDYFDYDMVRTENTEVQEFGKKIIEINDKYPLEYDTDRLKSSDPGEFKQHDIKEVRTKLNNYVDILNKREEAYKNVEVPEKCQKRMEMIIAAGQVIKDFVKNVDIKAEDSESYDLCNFKYYASIKTYENLVFVATGGAEYLDEEEEE